MFSLDVFIFSGVSGKPASRSSIEPAIVGAAVVESLFSLPLFVAVLSFSSGDPGCFCIAILTTSLWRRQLSTFGRLPHCCLKEPKPLLFSDVLLKYQSWELDGLLNNWAC